MKKLWFKRKVYGWGWTPVTWQGWLTVLVFAGSIILITIFVGPTNELASLIAVIFVTMLLLVICYAKGEKPKWQWGNKK